MTGPSNPGLGLPALDGRTPLGFLAALGVLRLVAEATGAPVTVSWSPRDCTAILGGTDGNVDDVVATLQGVVASIPERGVLPGLPADFPPPGAAPDRLRLLRRDYRAYAESLTGPAADSWLASLVTDLALDDKGRAGISLFAAPSGKQSMRTMLEKPLEFIRRQPDVLREALVSWRRYPGVTGEYLDNKVLYDAADAPDGEPRERGVPGATWLALMAYPLLRTSGLRGKPVTTGWQSTGAHSGSRRFVYPLWSLPMPLPSVVALLDHPVLADAEPGPAPAAARVLSIFQICGANRQQITGRNFAGVLTPLPPATRRPARGRAR